jgi:hypothetical protein
MTFKQCRARGRAFLFSVSISRNVLYNSWLSNPLIVNVYAEDYDINASCALSQISTC